MTQLTQDLLKSLLNYDPDTGVFTWLVQRRGTAKAGTTAGSINGCGYIHIRVNIKMYPAHRLAWLYVYGVWPSKGLDHINRVRTDNRIANLREATDGENKQNCSLHRNNSSGIKGVGRNQGKWRARISVDDRQIYLGRYTTIEDAIAARKAAEVKYHTHRVI